MGSVWCDVLVVVCLFRCRGLLFFRGEVFSRVDVFGIFGNEKQRGRERSWCRRVSHPQPTYIEMLISNNRDEAIAKRIVKSIYGR